MKKFHKNDMPKGWVGLSKENTKVYNLWANINLYCNKESSYYKEGKTIDPRWYSLASFYIDLKKLDNYKAYVSKDNNRNIYAKWEGDVYCLDNLELKVREVRLAINKEELTEELYLKWFNYTKKVILSRSSNYKNDLMFDIDSIANLILTKAWLYYDKSKGITFKTWLFSILGTELNIHYRKYQNDLKPLSLDAPLCNEDNLSFHDYLIDSKADINLHIFGDANTQIIDTLYSRLKGRDLVILDYTLNGLTQREIGERLGLSRTIPYNAQKKFRSILKSIMAKS